MTSGFGKVILLGEHAVVYGYPAIAGAVDLRVAARVCSRLGPADADTLTIPAWDLAVAAGDGSPTARALRALVDASSEGADEHWRIVATSTLPPRAGLGSSAALSVAVARALATAHREKPDVSEIESRAAAGERCFHDTPSGIDVAVAARGGLGTFDTAAGYVRLDAPPLQIVVGLTGEPRQTRDQVNRVAAEKERDPEATGERLETLGELARRGAEAIAAGDHRALGGFFNEAQAVLAALGVSSPGIDEMVGAATEAGAIGAKLTGAGGGGAVIALAPGAEDRLAAAWRKLGKEAFVTVVGEDR
jgi:mevalonate kinase